MLTLNQIRKDLKEIRYYYSRRKTLDSIFTDILHKAVQNTIQKYNEAISEAPLQLYDLYVNLYVMYHTQESLSEEWRYTPYHIYCLNKKLLLFLQKKLDDNDK